MRRRLIDLAVTIVLTLGIFFVIQTFVAQPYEVQQLSMWPTFEEGDYVLIDKLTPKFGRYSRGEVVVFNPVRRDSCASSGGDPFATTPFIKRVIGQAGDRVELRADGVHVNGTIIAEPYVHGLPTGPFGAEWVVPEDRVLLMGDNRPDSVDSRDDAIGLICMSDVVGRAFVRYWPLNKLGAIAAPAYGQSPGVAASPAPATTPAPAPESTPRPSSTRSAPTVSSTHAAVDRLRVEVIERRPHDARSYTQGLEMADGRLYEGNAYGPAAVREVDPDTGAIVRSVELDRAYFGEGITIVDDRLIQLTWQEHTAFIYRLSDLAQIGTFSYDTEGWGLCDDGTRLVMSDGTSRLYFRDRETFEVLGTVDVTNDGLPSEGLNELECVDGVVYANVYPTETIMRIDPTSGFVTGVIDASGLLGAGGSAGEEGAVLNGIAYDETSQTFLLTGKLWPALFEVRFISGDVS
jgi:glutaminyl-peptide cyclotransferase